jgi:O-antigen/teichoic acid export membrane protein
VSAIPGWLAASVAGFGVRGVEVVAKLALYMLAARRLGDEECGVLFLCLTWITLAGTVSRLGMEKALSRLIAAELALQQGPAVRRLWRQGGLVTLGGAMMVGLGTAAVAATAADWLFHSASARPALLATALAVPALSLAVTYAFALVGFGRTVLSQILQNLSWPLGLLAGVLAGIDRADLLMLIMAATQILAVLAAFLAFAQARGQLDENRPLAEGVEKLPTLWRTARPLYVVELVQVSIQSLPVLLLGVFSDPKAVGVFSIALRASMLVLVVLLSLGLVAAPRFAALHRQRNWGELAQVCRRTQLAGLVFGGGACLVLAVAGRPILSLIGPHFTAGAPALLVLLAGQLVNSAYAGQDSMLAMTGHGSSLRVLNLLQLAVMLALCLVLIPRFGAMGAALVTAIVTAQGALGAAMASASFHPRAAPLFIAPLPPRMRHLLVRWAE